MTRSFPGSAFRGYLAILRSPGVPTAAVGAALASLPIGFLGLALLLLVRHQSGMAAAGSVVACFGVGTVSGMIIQGWLIDRYVARTVLLAAAAVRVAAAAVFLALLRLDVSVWLVLPAAFCVGMSEPQVISSLRAALPTLIPAGLRAKAAALSSLLFELPVVVGPLLLSLLMAFWRPELAVALAAALSVGGALLFGRCSASRIRRQGPPVSHGPLRPLAVSGVRSILWVAAVLGFATGSVQTVAAAVAASDGAPGDAGMMYALLSVSSLFGTMRTGLTRATNFPAGIFRRSSRWRPARWSAPPRQPAP